MLFNISGKFFSNKSIDISIIVQQYQMFKGFYNHLIFDHNINLSNVTFR